MHTLQLQLPTSKKFAIDRGESLSDAIWSDFETIIVMEVSQSSEYKDASTITKLYNDIVYYSSSLFCSCPLPHSVVFREKTIHQVQSKVQHMHSRT